MTLHVKRYFVTRGLHTAAHQSKCAMHAFTAKVGGWFGLFVGASLISFAEIFYFIFLLCRGVCKKMANAGKMKTEPESAITEPELVKKQPTTVFGVAAANGNIKKKKKPTK